MDNIKYWIALEQAEGMGPAHLKEIYNLLSYRQLSILDLFGLTGDEIKKEFPLTDKVIDGIIKAGENLAKIENNYLELLDRGYSVVPFYSDTYPRRLHDRLGNGIPPFLYFYGNSSILKMKGIAILGDKNVSSKGGEIAYTAAREISSHKLSTISGYASGADMIAHRSALENEGHTIAVVPYGLLKFNIHDSIMDIYNPDRIIVVSTFYPDHEATKFHAFIRNKIICALASTVYIVESPAEGGIFEAAKSASKLGVPLYVTQYAQYPKSAEGNEKIIKEMGGKPVKGRYVDNFLVPNMDSIIGQAKFG